MKTREQIITDMCYTMRHDYGITKEPQEFTGDNARTIFANDYFNSGMYPEERDALWNAMAQLFDNCIAPYIKVGSDRVS